MAIGQRRGVLVLLTPLILIPLPFLFVPFFIAVAMPNRVCLAVCAVVLAAGIAYLRGDGSFDGPGGLLAAVLWAAMAIGAAVGVIARGIGLGLSSFGAKRAIVQSPVLVAFLVLALGFSWLFVVKPKLDARPASQACLTSIIHIKIGGRLLSTPPAPVVQISNGYIADYGLSSAKGTRLVCSATDNGLIPLTASSLSLRFGDLKNHRKPNLVERTFCTMAKPGGWVALWCDRFNAPEALADWPETLVVGLSSDFSLRHPFLLNGPPREELAAGLAKSAGSGNPIVGLPAVGFVRYKMPSNAEYWVSTDPSWRLPDNAIYLMDCSLDRCRVAFSIDGTVFAGYSFQAPIEGREARSRAVYSKAMTLLDELHSNR
ncbi:hypothetical protein X770_27485 [Mesorhizobium sp. LSJC269B00]|nr:hypothetical protein X770_27485 [Mesorhizobium sp. LSJC269B00]